MNWMTTNVVIGRMTATKLGISRPVSSHEDAERQSVVDHKLDEPQRLHQPHEHGEAAGDRDERQGKLAKDVAVEPRDQLPRAHCA